MVAPIINQPQVAILSTDGVSPQAGGGDRRARQRGDRHPPRGQSSPSAWDHRAFDGAYAAAFLSRVREIMETRDWDAEF